LCTEHPRHYKMRILPWRGDSAEGESAIPKGDAFTIPGYAGQPSE